MAPYRKHIRNQTNKDTKIHTYKQKLDVLKKWSPKVKKEKGTEMTQNKTFTHNGSNNKEWNINNNDDDANDDDDDVDDDYNINNSNKTITALEQATSTATQGLKYIYWTNFNPRFWCYWTLSSIGYL